MDQVRAVGRVSEGLQKSTLRLGTSTRSGLQEPHPVAQVRGGGDEEQVHQPRAERVGPRRHAPPEGRPAMVQVHPHGGGARQCRRRQTGIERVNERFELNYSHVILLLHT